MLMSVYLEEANYARAEALLEENFQFRSTRNDDCVRNYFALAGQAVNGARNHLARYRNVGINTTDPNLAAEALNDLNRLRSLLERMIAQAREISKDRKAYDSLSLLEDVLGIRLLLATDREDQAKWESEYSGARELLASSLTEVASLGGIPMIPLTKTPLTIVSTANPTKPVPETQAPEKQDSRDSAESQKPNDLKPLETGLLNAKATKRVLPSYPNLAKLSGATGLVRVYVVVDENGKVAEVSRSEGPLLLRQAAEEAARQWFFVAILSNGKPARVSGYIDFNFMP
jgi:TonB family protein